MSLPKPMNERLSEGVFLPTGLLYFEFLKHPKPHRGIKELEQGLRKSIRQQDRMNVNQQLLV